MGTITELLDRLEDVTSTSTVGTFLARCPAHEDTRPSLVITLQDDGKVLLHCRAGCPKRQVVVAMGITMSQLFDVEPGEHGAVASSGPPSPPTADQIAEIDRYITAANALYKGSPAAVYAEERFGVSEDLGYFLSLGFDDGTLDCEWTTPAYRRSPRLVVPFFGFDEVPRALQGRALNDDSVRWCGLRNPPGHSWATIGAFLIDGDDANLLICEGPGDALTSVAAGTSAVLVRGAALSRNTSTIDTLVAGTHGRRVILAGDADDSGLDFNLTVGAALASAGHQVHTLSITDGGDLTDWRGNDPTRFKAEFDRSLRSATRIDANAIVSTSSYDGGDDDGLLSNDGEHPLFPMSDEGNAQRLLLILAGAGRWCPELGWVLYVDGTWQRDTHRFIDRAMATCCNAMHNEAAQFVQIGEVTGNDDLISYGVALESHACRSENSPKFDHAIKRAQSMAAIQFELFDKHDHLLVVQNGTIDLRTGTLGPHDPSHLLTQKVDVPYNPEAPASRWRQFLLEVFNGDVDLVEYTKRGLGYGITGSTREQCFLVFHGSGANGKTVMLNALQAVFQSLVGVASFSAFEQKPAGSSTADLAALRGCRLVFAQEGERNRPMAEAVIKRVSGSDPMTARHLYKDAMTFRPTWLLILATNYLPRFGGQDEGLWRRVKLVPFGRYFTPEERDVMLGEKLAAEAQGILAWVIEGAVEWYRNGLTDPPVIANAAKTYQSTSDELAGFVDFVIVADDDAKTPGTAIYNAYIDWSHEEGVRPWSRTALFGALCERIKGAKKMKRRDGIWLYGLRLSTEADRGGGDENR